MTAKSLFVVKASSSSSFLRYRVFLVKFNYWSKFHVNLIAGSKVMTVFCKGFGKNSAIGNTTFEFCIIYVE